jgi:hypothetical protein
MLFGLWPTCAKKDCGALAFVKFEFTEGAEIFEAWLCFACMTKAPELFAAASEVREEERLAGSLGDISPVEDHDGFSA